MTPQQFVGHVRRHWALLFADWRREYRTDVRDELDAGIGWWEFTALVGGFSAECRFWAAVAKAPVKASTPEAIAAITGRYLGPA